MKKLAISRGAAIRNELSLMGGTLWLSRTRNQFRCRSTVLTFVSALGPSMEFTDDIFGRSGLAHRRRERCTNVLRRACFGLFTRRRRPGVGRSQRPTLLRKKTRPLRRRSCLKFYATRGCAFAFWCLAAIVHDEMQEEHQDEDAAEGNNNRGAGGRVE